MGKRGVVLAGICGLWVLGAVVSAQLLDLHERILHGGWDDATT